MRGDLEDMVARLRAMLPKRWFGETASNFTGLLTSLATPAVWLFDLVQYLSAQTRIGTASDLWLDLIAPDYFGDGLVRQSGETDGAFRARIKASLLQSAATRPALISALTWLVGKPPEIFEPARAADTGAYATLASAFGNTSATMVYGQLGGWGNLSLPNQVFITINRPATPLIANLSGYNCSYGGYGKGSLSYIDLRALVGNVSDTEIQELIVQLLPVNTTAWLRLI